MVEKYGQKFSRFKPKFGFLVLTDKRFLFISKSGQIGKKVAATYLAPFLAYDVAKSLDKISPKELEQGLQDPNSLSVDIRDIVEVKAEGDGLWKAHKLTVTQMNEGKNNKIIFGSTDANSSLKDWVQSINNAKSTLQPL
jgi:hypothetical protein